MKFRRIAPESWIILFVGMLDLVTTLVWIGRHGAREANPIFQRYLEGGVAGFVLAKLACLLAPIFILEFARRRRPQFTLWASRFAIAAYLLFYAVGVVRLNMQSFRPRSPELASAVVLYGINDQYVSRAEWMITHPQPRKSTKVGY